MAIAFHENFGQPAPSAELRKRDLLLMRRNPFSGSEFFQQTDRLEIRLNPCCRSHRHHMPAVIQKIPQNHRSVFCVDFGNALIHPRSCFNFFFRLNCGEGKEIQLHHVHIQIPFGWFFPHFGGLTDAKSSRPAKKNQPKEAFSFSMNLIVKLSPYCILLHRIIALNFNLYDMREHQSCLLKMEPFQSRCLRCRRHCRRIISNC